MGSVFIDATPPVLRELTIRNIREDGFDLWARAEDNDALAGFTVTLVSEAGERRETFLLSDGSGRTPWSAEGIPAGTWTVTVAAEDQRGNRTGHTLRWKYTAGEARPGYSVTHYG